MVGAVNGIARPRFGAMLLKLSPDYTGTLHVFPLGSAPPSYSDDTFILAQETDKGEFRQAKVGKAPWVTDISATLPSLESSPFAKSPALQVELWRENIMDGLEEGLSYDADKQPRVFQSQPGGPRLTASELFNIYRKSADFSRLLNDGLVASWPYSAMDEHIRAHDGLVMVQPEQPSEKPSAWSVNYWLDKLFLRGEPQQQPTLPATSSFFQIDA